MEWRARAARWESRAASCEGAGPGPGLWSRGGCQRNAAPLNLQLFSLLTCDITRPECAVRCTGGGAEATAASPRLGHHRGDVLLRNKRPAWRGEGWESAAWRGVTSRQVVLVHIRVGGRSNEPLHTDLHWWWCFWKEGVVLWGRRACLQWVPALPQTPPPPQIFPAPIKRCNPPNPPNKKPP